MALTPGGEKRPLTTGSSTPYMVIQLFNKRESRLLPVLSPAIYSAGDPQSYCFGFHTHTAICWENKGAIQRMPCIWAQARSAILAKPYFLASPSQKVPSFLPDTCQLPQASQAVSHTSSRVPVPLCPGFLSCQPRESGPFQS